MKNNTENPRELDRFESALLTELRSHVADRSESAVDQTVAPEGSRPRRTRRWIAVTAGIGVAAAAAVGFAAIPNSPVSSAAYAVTKGDNGDVVVRVTRLDDADGLERALAKHGIDAKVTYDPSERTEFTVESGGAKESGDANGSDRAPAPSDDDAPGVVTRVDEDPQDDGLSPNDKDLDLCASPAPTFTRDGSDWVLRISSGSPLKEYPSAITTGPEGRLTTSYSPQRNVTCGSASAQN